MSATKAKEAILKIEAGEFAPPAEETPSQPLLDDELEEKEPQVLFDRRAPQRVTIKVEKGTATFHPSFDINLPSDEEYFKAQEAVAAAVKREGESVTVYLPYGEAARKLVTARYGYKDNPDWRARTNWRDLSGVWQKALECTPEMDETNSEELLDDDTEVCITLVSPFAGKKTRTRVFFREMSNAETDEYILATQNKPPKDALASAAQPKSKERRLVELGRKVKTRVENYANDDIPAWHLQAAIELFGALEFIRVGKS